MEKNHQNFDYDKSASSPMDNYYWIEQGLFDYLQKSQNLTDEQLNDFKFSYKQRFDEKLTQVKPLIKNELDKGNVYFALIAVAAYEVFLGQGYSEQEAILLTDSCINKPVRSYIVGGTKMMFDYSENPFQSLVLASKERENSYFGDSFEFERPIDNEFGYVLHVKKCLFHEVLKVLNRQELQHSLCRMDLGWINAIDPEKHNMQFVRPTTFASGNTCQMWFMKKEKEFIKD